MLAYFVSLQKNRLTGRAKLHLTIQSFTLILTLFTFPFRPIMLNNICVIILAANWLFQGNLKAKFETLIRSKVGLLYVGLYAALVLSYFVSENKNQAAFVLEKNILVLIVPVVLATSAISKGQMVKAMYGFVAGCLLGVVICLGVAVHKYSLTKETYFFFYHDLSDNIGLHAVYYSLYLTFCILFLMLELNNKWRDLNLSNRLIYFLLILIFTAVVILLSSKTIIVGLILAVNLLFIIWIIRRNKLVAGILIILILNISVVTSIFKLDYVKTRFLDSVNSNIEFIKKDTYSELTVFTGVTVRITFWKFVIEILNENDAWWTGLTIGDGSDALHNKAVEKKLYGGNEERGWTDYTSYNPHNQYFQYLLFMGITGLVYFVLILIAIVSHAIKYRKLLLLLGTLLFMLFCLTESVLETNKGIIFFVTILPLLVFTKEFRDDTSLSANYNE